MARPKKNQEENKEVNNTEKTEVTNENNIDIKELESKHKAEMEALKASMMEEMKSMQAEILDGLKDKKVISKPEHNDKPELNSEDAFNMADAMDKPVTYFTYSQEKTFFGYTDAKTRQEIQPPHGNTNPIKFKKIYAYAKRSKTGKGMVQHKVSRVTVWSKKENDFIRNHPYFNITIFEKADQAEAINSTFATKLEEARKQVDSIQDHALLDRARNLGVEITEDPSELRKNVIHKIAAESVQSDKDRHIKAVNAIAESKEIMTKNNA